MENLYDIINASPYDSMEDIKNKYKYALVSETDPIRRAKINDAGHKSQIIKLGENMII